MNGLKEVRKAKGMSQTDLAEAVGIPQVAVSFLETYDVEAVGELKDRLSIVLEHNFYKGNYPCDELIKGDRKMSQNEKVLDYMIRHGSISQREAVQFGCYRLSARIHDLREQEYNIKTENKAFKNEYGRGYYAVYSLVGGRP